MKVEDFKRRVHDLWHGATIHKIASVSIENHIAVVQIGEDRPFIVGVRYGHPVPIDLHTVKEAQRCFREITNELAGVVAAMDVLMAPHEQRDWTSFNKLLGIQSTD